MKMSGGFLGRVDMTKVNMDVMRPWIAHKVTELLKFEDDVLINFIYDLLEDKVVNRKEIQCSLTGFMENNTRKFMKELWTHLVNAQQNGSWVPKRFLDVNEEETTKKHEREVDDVIKAANLESPSRRRAQSFSNKRTDERNSSKRGTRLRSHSLSRRSFTPGRGGSRVQSPFDARAREQSPSSARRKLQSPSLATSPRSSSPTYSRGRSQSPCASFPTPSPCSSPLTCSSGGSQSPCSSFSISSQGRSPLRARRRLRSPFSTYLHGRSPLPTRRRLRSPTPTSSQGKSLIDYRRRMRNLFGASISSEEQSSPLARRRLRSPSPTSSNRRSPLPTSQSLRSPSPTYLSRQRSPSSGSRSSSPPPLLRRGSPKRQPRSHARLSTSVSRHRQKSSAESRSPPNRPVHSKSDGRIYASSRNNNRHSHKEEYEKKLKKEEKPKRREVRRRKKHIKRS